jgi:hypothetical protein
MLRIQQHQLKSFADETRRGFVRMMDAYLREHFTGWVRKLPREDCETWVRAALAKCELYDVTTEPEAAQLILLLLILGLDADDSTPWVRETLGDGSLLPIGKVRKLIRLARAQGVNHLDDIVLHDDMNE